jgi:hypothetical protein
MGDSRPRPGQLFVNAHALQRARERCRSLARSTDQEVYKQIEEWLRRGVELGGQFGGRRIWLCDGLAVVVWHKPDGTREARSVLTREQALANVEAFGGRPSRKGKVRGRRKDDMAARRRKRGEE